MKGQFGWKKDKFDTRDYLHKQKLARLPTSADLSNLLPSVRDQGQVGSCTGFGIGANVSGVAKSLNAFVEWYSPTWIYNGARFIEGTLAEDVGANPRDCLDWLVESGCLLEHFWSYDSKHLDMNAPSSERMLEAIKYKNFAYYRVDNGVDGIMGALADGHLVSIGAPWFDKWMDASSSGDLAQVTKDDSVAGGHETLLYGYYTDLERLCGMNSWGHGWARDGMYLMPMSAIDVFKALGGYDAHYIVFDTPPVPPPVRKCCWETRMLTRYLRNYPRVRRALKLYLE